MWHWIDHEIDADWQCESWDKKAVKLLNLMSVNDYGSTVTIDLGVTNKS